VNTGKSLVNGNLLKDSRHPVGWWGGGVVGGVGGKEFSLNKYPIKKKKTREKKDRGEKGDARAVS